METKCRVCDKQLTAFFDGELASAELHMLQQHVQSCARCSDVWQAWGQTQAALRALPTPAAPSSLLSRVLMKCRMLGAQPLIGASAEPLELHHSLTKYLSTSQEQLGQDVELANDFQPPLAGAFKEVAVPPHLKAAILRKTVEQDLVSRGSGLAAPAFWDCVTDWVRGCSTPAHARWGYGLVVPATFALLLFTFQPGEVRVNSVPPAPEVSKVRAGIEPVAPVPKSVGSSAPVSELEPATEVVEALPSRVPVRLGSISSSVRNSLRDVVASVTPLPRQVAHTPAPAAPPPKQPDIAPRKPAARVAPAIAIAPTQRPQLRPVINTTQRGADVLRRLPVQDEPRISNPAPRVIQSKTLLATVDFDSALEAVRSLRDDRPDDLRQAVDDYRSSLVSFQDDDDDGGEN